MLSELKRVAGNMKRQITTDTKRDFREIFKIRLEKKNGPNNSILLDKTEFDRNEIFFEGKKNGIVDEDLNPKLDNRLKIFKKFNDYMNKAIKEYKKTPDSMIEEQIGGDIENPEFISNIVDDSILEIQNKIDNITAENNLKKFIDNNQDPRQTLFERDDLREFRGLVYL